MTPLTDGQDVQLDIFTFTDQIGTFERVLESPNWIERDAAGNVTGTHRTTTSLQNKCSRDIYCRAEANEHEPDCPVERRLKETFGY